MEDIIFYDITSKAQKCWSPNLWRGRMILNFKEVDYKTQWVEYPDISSLLQSFGVEPTSEEERLPYSPYTLPAIRLPDNRVIVDSANIAREMEVLRPEPLLHLDDKKVIKVGQMIPALTHPLLSKFIVKLPNTLMTERSREYFVTSRELVFGKTLEQVEKEGQGDSGWIKIRPVWEELVQLLKEEEGPYFLGKTSSYADIAVVCWLKFWKIIDEENIFKRVLEFDPAIGELYAACEQWVERDD